MDEQNVAQRIRQMFRNLFGSRYVNALEIMNMQLRQDYECRLIERDETIADLRGQLSTLRAKMDMWEAVIIPMASPVGKLFQPKREPTFEPMIEPESSWQAYQRQYYADQSLKETSNGVPESSGQEVQQ